MATVGLCDTLVDLDGVTALLILLHPPLLSNLRQSLPISFYRCKFHRLRPLRIVLTLQHVVLRDALALVLNF